MRIASIRHRFAARFVDLMIVTGVDLAFTSIFLEREDLMPANLAVLIVYLFHVAYSAVFLGRWGATPGKMIFRLKVVAANGERISDGRALARAWGEFLSTMILYIGYLVAFFDKSGQNQALHDRMCKTRVIYR